MRAVQNNRRAGASGRRGATTECPGCCGPCNVFIRANGCGSDCAGEPIPPIFICNTSHSAVIVNGLCYSPDNSVAYWRYTPVPGLDPIPAGAVVVDPVDSATGCDDPRCGNSGGMWVRGHPCQGDPGSLCPPIYICAANVPACRYYRFACADDQRLICYKFDPLFQTAEHDLPPGALRFISPSGYGFSNCCECMEGRGDPSLPECASIPLTDYPCIPTSRCAFPIPGQLGGIELRPCRCCCSDEDTYSLDVYFRRVDLNSGGLRSWEQYSLSGSSTWDAVNRLIRATIQRDINDGFSHTIDTVQITISVACGWGNMNGDSASIWSNIMRAGGNQPHRCTVGCDEDSPGFFRCLDSFGHTNTCDAWGYSAVYHTTLNGVRVASGRDQFRLSRVYAGICVGNCSGGGNSVMLPGGGCKGCGGRLEPIP